MTLNVLISCMHQTDMSIIERSNVQTDVVVVNQCDHNSVEEFDFTNKYGRKCHAKFISTTERGLSRSRNMAVSNAWGDICLICDDDETLADDCETKILNAYNENPNAGLIAFALIRKDCAKKYPRVKKTLGFKQIIKTSSLQISFSRNLMKQHNIVFDEKMGSGTGNGGGEENMFMFAAKRGGLKLLYYPDVIAMVHPSPSQWFYGYTDSFFQNFGWASRRIHGVFIGFIYITMWVLLHKRLYCKSTSMYNAYRNVIIGFCDER